MERATVADAARPLSPVAEHLRRYGHLESTGAETPKDELLALLRLAAEVEHALLVQYLYAAASISPNPDAHQRIKDVAIQEMAHFISVENLLLAIGGPSEFHIGRDSIRAYSPFNPLPLNLEPISKLTLTEYVLVEMPASFPAGKESVQARIATLQTEVAQQTGLIPHRVGALYAKIYWILQPTDEPFGPISLSVDRSIGFDAGWHIEATDFAPSSTIAAHQAEPGEWWSSSGPDMRIHLVSDAMSAVIAVNSVMEQGEGLGHAEESHFYDFLNTLTLFEEGTLIVLPLPKNPYVGRLPPGVSQGSQIQHPYVKLWANLLNVRYTSLLMDIGHSLSLPRSNADRSILLDLALVNMRTLLKSLIAQMIAPAMQALDPNAGPTFELFREDLPESPRDCWLRQSELLDLERKIQIELNARPELAQDISGTLLCSDLEANWLERRQFVDSRLNAS